jgi:uncharacterized protein YdeI (YjbR/CyaY-like superfamily)
MNIGKTLSVSSRKQWRSWLAKHHDTEPEIWLVYYKKNSGRRRLAYNHAVEEALCYGWIDSIAKPLDQSRWAQRFTPRKKGSKWSPMNIERLHRLVAAGRVTQAGKEAAKEAVGAFRGRNIGTLKKPVIPPDILSALRSDPVVWRNFSRFPESYKRIRIGWIDGSRRRPVFFRRRLNYFVRMTRLNKRFGMVQ